MISLGFQKRLGSRTDESDVGMLDVSANALAVLILATMLVISAAAPPSLRGEVRREEAPDLFYPSPIDAALAPNSRYIVVLKEGMVELDLDAIALALSEGRISAETAQGKSTLVTDRRLYRDLNDYRLRILPDWDALAQAASPFNGESAAQEDETASRLFESQNIATTYFVTTGAIGDFADLYWKLRTAQTPIRWATVDKGENIIFSRRVQNFERRGRQWQ